MKSPLKRIEPWAHLLESFGHAACVVGVDGILYGGNAHYQSMVNDWKVFPKITDQTIVDAFIECSKSLILDPVDTIQGFLIPEENYSIQVTVLKDEEDLIFGYIFNFKKGLSLEERKRNIFSVPEYNERLIQQIMDILPINIYWHNLEGIIVGCNRQQALSLGLKSVREVIGKSLFDLVPKRTASELLKKIQSVLLHKKKETTEEKLYYQSGEFYFASTKAPLFLGKELVGVMGFSVDVTEVKNSEKNLRAANIEQEKHIGAKKEFLSNIKHDFRTPLSGIIGYAESLLDIVAPEHQERVTILVNSCKEITSIINKILEVSAVSDSQYFDNASRCSLFELFQELEALYAPLCSLKNIEFIIDKDPSLQNYYLVDTPLLRQVLLDLVSNAVNFTVVGKVSLSAYLHHKTDKESVVVFIVEDTGIGMTPEQTELAFSYFQRFSSSYHGKYSGLGLGLWRAKMVMEQLHGEIYLNSCVDKGTSVKCVVPMRPSLIDDVLP